MTASLSGAPRLQHSWDSRAACNFIGGGAGSGLLLAAAAALPAGWAYFPAGTLGFGLIAFGLSMVWLEIGRPFRALNVFFHPRTSWMTREAIVAVPLLALLGIAVAADQKVVTLPLSTYLPVSALAWVVAALAIIFLYCQARILKASKGIPAWREPSLQQVIFTTGIAEGLGLLLLLALFVAPAPGWAIPVSIIALAARAAAWEHYRHRIRLQPIPAPARLALERISWPFYLFGHALPAILLAASLATQKSAPLIAVAGLAMAAAGAWLKFDVVTRAAFTQGFSIPFMPVRGRQGA
jgi:phenylacetyl-CoA:acceptor oxidoreductase 26-kDa subunit